MSYHAIEQLPFGDIVLDAVWTASAAEPVLDVRRVEISPTLPDGMAVDFITAFLIDLTPQGSLQDFTFECRRVSCPSKGEPCNGENLAALEWSVAEGLLTIGTEDGETLEARLPWLAFGDDRYPITHLPDGLRVSIDYLPPKRHVDFHLRRPTIRSTIGTAQNDSPWTCRVTWCVPHRHGR